MEYIYVYVENNKMTVKYKRWWEVSIIIINNVHLNQKDIQIL